MADLKDLTRRFYKEVFENRNIDAIDDLVAEDAIDHEEPPPGLDMKPGREGIKQLLTSYMAAFNPLTVQVHEEYRDGNTVITHLTFSGTHTGEFAGIPASGKTFHIDGIDIMRYEGDRMAEHWGQFDSAGLLMQLGVLPPMS